MELVFLLLILSAGFYMSWNIGANDVANAMGTSVGSGALTLRQALYVASVLEFSGAFFFGSHVSETMQNGIINSELFVSNPHVLFLGMLSALIGTGIWLQLASYFGWPVSTTHTIVGAIIGFGALIGGWEAIYWDNVSYIASSWVLSPLFGGLFSYMLFNVIRRQIFYAASPLQATKRLLPYLVFLVFFLLTLLLLFNGLENMDLNMGFIEAFAYSAAISLMIAFGTAFFLKQIPLATPSLSPPSKELSLQLKTAKEELQQAKILASKEKHHLETNPLMEELQGTVSALEKASHFDHTKADFEVIERLFGWLQIMSACLMAFAHGANDVANAIGPFSAALHILNTGKVAFQTAVPPWALALGGIGIVVGLATWGWRVIETIGKKITELTPTRGFSAEFGAAATILIASRLGMPISTTHTLVGAVIGVGLARGIGALNMGMTRDIVISWIITIPAGAFSAVAVYKFFEFIFLPS